VFAGGVTELLPPTALRAGVQTIPRSNQFDNDPRRFKLSL